MAERMPGADFRSLLNRFNDQWVEAARFMSVPLLLQLLELAGQWTHHYYRDVDPNAPGEPVLLFGTPLSGTSPFWQAIAREYLERWVHHSQIRRALGLGSLSDPPFLEIGHAIVATVAGSPTPGDVAAPVPAQRWMIGPLDLGPRAQAADILTIAHTAVEVAALVQGPSTAVQSFAAQVGRR